MAISISDAVFFALEVNDFCVDGGLGAVEMLDKRHQAAFIEKFVFFLRALVFDGDLDAAIQKRQLAQSLRQNIEAKIRRFKDLAVGFERYPSAALFGLADFLQLPCGSPRS